MTTINQPAIWQLIDSSTIGGIERHIEMLAGVLKDAGYNCEVVLYDEHGKNPWFKQLEAARIPYHVLGGTTRGLYKAIKSQKPALIHTHGYKAGILGRAAARLSKTPVVSTFHSGERGPFPVSMYQYVDEMSAFLAPAIAVSKPILKNLPHGSDLMHNFVTMPTSAADVTNPNSRIGFVGRFSSEKGPDYFCALAKSLCGTPEFERVSWHAYGDGPMLADLKKSSSNHVTFHGMQTDMTDIWPTLDLLVIPSRAEGLPLAALEAFSHGIPVVAAKLGALPDVIKHSDTGWLFNAGDMETASRHITQWVTKSTAQKTAMFTACCETIRNNFLVESRLEKLIQIYKKSGFKTAA